MNIKLGLLLFMGLAAVSSMPISTPSKRPSIMQVLDLVEMGHLSFMFDLNRLEEEIKNPEALTKEDLNSMGAYVDKQTASIGKQLDMTRWLKLRTRLESTEWMRVDEMVNFLGSMHAQFNKLRTDIHHWIILKDYHHSNDTMKPFPDLLPYTTTTLAPLSTQTPFHSLINIDMDRYGKNETVVLWKKLAVELRNNHNDLAKVEELANRSLMETGKVMDRVESIWARLRVMDNKTEEYKVAKNDVEFLTTMARRLYTRHEDAVLRANKLRELIASGKIPQAPVPTTTTTTPMPTTTQAPAGFVEIPSEKKQDDGDWIALVGDAMILSAQDTEKFPF